jgi:formylglycine-generating enzyme required for sulfatase activity
LYGEAAKHIKDVAILEDIRKQSDILSEQLALNAIDLSDKVALLPKGEFLVGSNRESDSNQARTEIQSGNLIIDRYLVTNADFKANFVDKDGYSEGDWWSAEGLALLKQGKFVDATGKPGPANWADGAFDSSLAKYPVTGISWYEAEAYARLNKKRLPTAEEWEIAAGAPTTNGVALSEYPFQGADAPKYGDIVAPREVGVTSWDASPIKCRDMGSNVAEWTAERSNGTAVVKGAEPGLHPRLFERYARRAKSSFAKPADRSTGRGFRCIEDFVYDAKKDDDDKKN